MAFVLATEAMSSRLWKKGNEVAVGRMTCVCRERNSLDGGGGREYR